MVASHPRGSVSMRRQCIEVCQVGAKLRDVHHLSVRLLSEGLSLLGIFPGLDASSIAHNAYRAVYPHSVGEPTCQLLLEPATTVPAVLCTHNYVGYDASL